MKNCIKTELWKALHHRMFFLSLVLGMLIVTLHTFEVAKLVCELTPQILTAAQYGAAPGYTGISLPEMWIGMAGIFSAPQLFFILWPVLAAIPFGWSYARERKTGVYNQIVTRCNPRQYFAAKYLAVFTAGGVASMLPMLADLLILATFCPYEVPNCIPGASLSGNEVLSILFYTSPWLYQLSWCAIQFLWGGAAACLCFVTGTRFRLRLLTILFPFALMFLLTVLYRAVQGAGLFFPHLFSITLSPLEMTTPQRAYPGWAILLLWGLTMAAGLLAGYRQVVKRELV